DTPGALFDAMDRAGRSAVYVKLTCGSSASCVALVQRARAGVSVTTSLEPSGDRLYNSLRVRRYARPEIVDRVLGFILAEGAHVEEAIAKQPARGVHADVRILFVRRDPLFSVLRTSRTPITNLHLGGRRGDVDAYRATLPDGAWEAACEAGSALAGALGTW